MSEPLKNCWELRGCGLECGGAGTGRRGACIAARERLGHSCWAIAGTLSGGAVECVFAMQEGSCMLCPVLKSYHRIIGTQAKRVVQEHPEEQQRYHDLLLHRMKGTGGSARGGASPAGPTANHHETARPR